MSKRQRKLIAQFADRLEDDGSITESMYGVPVKRGNEAIDQLIHQVEMNFIDWDWNSKAFQKLMSHVYKGKPPTSPQQLAGELQRSVQEPQLKQKLADILGSTKAAPAPAPQQAAPAPKPQVAAPAAAPPPAPKPQVQTQPRQMGGQPQSPQQWNLSYNQTYTVEYQNFRGQHQTYKNAQYVRRRGNFLIFEFPRPANRPNPGWHHGKAVIRNQQDIQAKRAEIAQNIADMQAQIAYQSKRRFRVHGGWYTLADLKRKLPGWTKSIQNAESIIQNRTNGLNNSIQWAQQRLTQNIPLDPPIPMRKSFRADRILSVK